MTPANLNELRAISGPAARAKAAAEYIARREEAIREARQIRDDAVREFSQTHSISATAMACGISVATVKVIKR